MKNRVKSVLLFTFFIGLIYFDGYSQEKIDSTITILEEDSIVYIDEPALVIQKTIVEEQVIYNNWFLEGSFGSFIHINRHLICQECIDYRNEMIKSILPIMGKNLSLKLLYSANKSNLIYAIGLSNTTYREKFNYSFLNKKDLNRYNYIDVSIGTGYWINRRKKVAFIVNVDLLYSRLISKKGSTLDYVDSSKVLNIEEVDRDARNLISGRMGIKALFFNHKRVKFFIEPYSRANFTSVLDYKENYYWRRWSYGLGIGFLYVL